MPANVESRHAGDFLLLWNQEGADTGSFLFAGMARSYKTSLVFLMLRYTN